MSKCKVKKTKELNVYKVEFSLTQGELVALYNALNAYGNKSMVGDEVRGYLRRGITIMATENGLTTTEIGIHELG